MKFINFAQDSYNLKLTYPFDAVKTRYINVIFYFTSYVKKRGIFKLM